MRGIDHQEKAADNYDFESKIPFNHRVRNDWSVTILFYSALHYVDNYLERCDATYYHRDHRNRIYYAKIHLNRDAFNKFNKLYKMSRNARYFHRDLSYLPPTTLQEYRLWINTIFSNL